MSKGCKRDHQMARGKVIRTTRDAEWVWRERKCKECGTKIVTVEKTQEQVVKQEQRDKEMNRKLEVEIGELQRTIVNAGMAIYNYEEAISNLKKGKGLEGQEKSK